MCGIVGIIDKNRISQSALINMRDRLSHRGPDDSGFWVSGAGNVGLAHRRLSIIDLSPNGRQPMSDNEGKIWITYNGEVYNFKEIRIDLEKKGYRFRNHTDTEVVLCAYEEWQESCVEKFNGMFAFGIYDMRRDRLFLARDRVGKKPIYYSQYNGKFIFASELKVLIQEPDFSKEIDFNALNFYFAYGYIPGELTIFKSVKKLPPGHCLVYDLKNNEIKKWRYWEITFEESKVTDEEELLEELENLLEDAVRIRLMSDVPLGVFLSGGIDSSLVTAFMSRVSDKPVKTFSIGFDEKNYNELPYARTVAEYFGSDHHQFFVKPDIVNVLPELSRQLDEPFADSSIIPTYYISKQTRQHVTVALSGDGGDELFGGYDSYSQTIRDKWLINTIPSFMRKLAAKTIDCLPFPIKGQNSIKRLSLNPNDSFVDRNLLFNQRMRSKLLKDEVIAELGEIFDFPERYRKGWMVDSFGNFKDQMTYSDFNTLLPDDILVKVDRASMLVSLEVRAPLLDYRIAEFSFEKIPGYMKINGITKKYLLKKLAKKVLPPGFTLNRKQGFGLPVAEWFRGDLRGFMSDVLLNGRSKIFNKRWVQTLIDSHINNGTNEGYRLFGLLMFELWWENYI